MALIADYIFVDKRRIDSYFEQISPPLKYTKRSSWKVALGLTGPQVEGTQSMDARPYTLHEKLTTLVKRIDPSRNLPRDLNDPQVFYLETFYALRALLPTRLENSERQGLVLWICQKINSRMSTHYDSNDHVLASEGYRFLIEDFHDDEGMKALSAYSALQHIYYNYSNDFKGTPIAEFLDDESSYFFSVSGAGRFQKKFEQECVNNFAPEFSVAFRELIKAAGEERYRDYAVESKRMCDQHHFKYTLSSGEELYYATIEFQQNREGEIEASVNICRAIDLEGDRKFDQDPVKFLRELGATVTPRRLVDVFYQVRVRGISRTGFSAVGYPLFIAASPSPFLSL